MERILLFIKHHLGALWKIIDWGNGMLFRFFYGSKMRSVASAVMDGTEAGSLTCKELQNIDIQSLKELIESQPVDDLTYFSPHAFDLESLKAQLRNPAFLMMGIFDNQGLIGYFFLRFFANKKCFVGRLIDNDHRGKGIGSIMNTVMYETAWGIGFRCLSTISRNNTAVMRAHEKNPTMVILKSLPNDYLLVEFIRRS